MTWATLLPYLDTIMLLVVTVACVLHLATNVDARSAHCERFGFTFTGAGAFGTAVYIWWPKIEQFPFEPMMHLGMALIAGWLVQGKLRHWLAATGFHWAERRRSGAGQ